MADERAFNVYFANRGKLPGEVTIEGDELLVLRGSTVYKVQSALDFAYAAMEDNVVETTINVQSVFEPIEGLLVAGIVTDGFTFAANQFTFVGTTQAIGSIFSAKMSLLKSGGGANEIYRIAVFVNGSPIGTGMSCSSSNTLVGYAFTTVTHVLQQGDIIEMQIANITGTSDCTVSDAQLILG